MQLILPTTLNIRSDMMNCMMRKSESESLHLKNKSGGGGLTAAMKRSKTCNNMENAHQQLIPMEYLVDGAAAAVEEGGQRDANGNEGCVANSGSKQKGGGLKIANTVLKTVFESMKNIRIFSRSPTFNTGKRGGLTGTYVLLCVPF